jgi:hypothetical protein
MSAYSTLPLGFRVQPHTLLCTAHMRFYSLPDPRTGVEAHPTVANVCLGAGHPGMAS